MRSSLFFVVFLCLALGCESSSDPDAGAVSDAGGGDSGADAGGVRDGGAMDAGSPDDAGSDAATPDAGSEDAGGADAAVGDAGDASTIDDAGPPDAGPMGCVEPPEVTSTGTGTVLRNGTTWFSPSEGIATYVTTDVGGGEFISRLRILLTDYTNACGLQRAQQTQGGGQELGMPVDIRTTSAGGAPVPAPGTYGFVGNIDELRISGRARSPSPTSAPT